MLNRVKPQDQEDASEFEWPSLTSVEKSLIRLYRVMPSHEQRQVLRVAEALALSKAYSPVWSVVERV